ncbi:MAG: hypothetical protein U0T73_06030 [Chitinophagales bacterium]
MKQLKNKWVVAALLLLLSFIFYGNSLQNDFSLDDSYLLKEVPNREVTLSDVLHPFKKRFDFVDYRPVPVSSFIFEKWLTGENDPHFSHFINFALYAALCFSVFLVITTFSIEGSWWLAIGITLLFLAHPSHSNVVNNLKSRDNLFSMLFGTLAFYFAMLPVNSGRDYWKIVAAFLLINAALVSKLDAMGFIPIIALGMYLFGSKRSLPRIGFIFLLLMGSFLFIREGLIEKYIPVQSLNEPIVFTENPVVTHPEKSYAFSQSITTLWEYIKMMVWPKGYFFYYGYDMVPLLPLSDFRVIALLCLHLVVGGMAVYALIKKRPLVCFGICSFYAALAYCANLQQPVAGIIADRYAFIASLGFCVLLASVLLRFSKQPFLQKYFEPKSDPRKKKEKPLAADPVWVKPFLVLTAAVALVYFPFTHSRNADWKNIFSLLEADMPHLERSFEANRIAATQYINKASTMNNPNDRNYGFQKALQYSKQANALYPKMIHEQESEGICYYMLGMTDSCFNHFARVRAIFDTTSVGWEMTGDIFAMRKQNDSALHAYERVLQLDPENEQARMKLKTLERSKQ